MKIDVLCEILEKIITSSSATQVEVYADGKDPGNYVITSVSVLSDGRVIINATNRIPNQINMEKA